MAEDRLAKQEIPLSGKLITSRDPSTIGPNNFRQLTNLRYTDTNPQGIGGMSKINTTTISGKPHIRSGFHFTKDQPSESHILIQAFNATLDESAIYENTTAIPSAGNFTATALFSEPSGASVGVFSDAPGGDMAYCNKKGAYLWGGSEMRVGAFINYAPDDSFRYDYTEHVQDTISSGGDHIATLKRVSESLDATFLMHMETATTDSSASSHTVVNTSTAVTTKKYVFGSKSASFDGSASRLRIRDRAAFNFSGGAWTLDTRMRLRTAATLNPFYYQKSKSIGATNYIKLYSDDSGRLKLALRKAGATLELKTASSQVSANTWYHAEVDESGDNYYLFVDGQLKATRSSSFRLRDLTSSIDIGWDRSNYYSGWLDEYRVCKSAKHTADFELPLAAYSGTITSRTYCYVGATRPLKGFKFYVGTANTTAGSMAVEYWTGSAWASVTSLVDNTASGGIPLAQTGTVTFATTESVAKVKVIDSTILYWYRVSVTDCDNTATVYRVTLDAPFQTIKDIWDGINRSILSFQIWNGTTFNDYTTNVYSSEYDSTNSGTYAELDSLSSANYFVCGFEDRQMGVSFSFVSGKGNTTANTVCTVYYWNGTAWTSVGVIEDGTSQSGKSLSRSGVITWNPPADGLEFKREVTKEVPLYYYKFKFSQTLSADVQVYHVTGFPAQETIGYYSFPVMAMNRLWLLSEQDNEKNKALTSAINTSQILNGEDSLIFHIGDESEIMGGASVYMQLGSSLYDAILICKKNESWIIFQSEGQYYQYRVSNNKGLVAPNTMRSISLSDSEVPNGRREIPIWQGADGVYTFIGSGPMAIDSDITDIFDATGDSIIKKSKIGNSYGFCYRGKDEYHLLYAHSNTLDKELVFDFKRQKWFQVDRGTGNALQCGFSVMDTNGNPYSYGAKQRYLMRIENGCSFDGTPITHTMWLGDGAYEKGSLTDETSVRHLRFICKAKKVTNNSIDVSYYRDSAATANKTFTMSQKASGKRLAMPIRSLGEGGATFHSLKFTASTDNEVVGFEPLAIGVLYKHVRQKLKE